VEDIRTRTSTDVVYETLHDQIVSLDILPGTKLSETEVARRFGVSRQPVRNAFTKLGNEDLLLIRSMERVELTRLVRRAVELEVVYDAVQIWDLTRERQLNENLKRQETALRENDLTTFHALDYDFHKLIYVLGGNPMAFEVMLECKKKVDRLCMLGLEKESEAKSIFADHCDIAKGLASGDLDLAQASVRKHLSRLDKTIDYIHKTHPSYFE